MIELMISLSVGMMLSTSLLHALPEAFEMHVQPNRLFLTLLIGLLAFFLLEKFSILRHSHHHEGDGHHHEKGFDKHEAGSANWGKNARKKILTFGLVIFIKIPRRYNWPLPRAEIPFPSMDAAPLLKAPHAR